MLKAKLPPANAEPPAAINRIEAMTIRSFIAGNLPLGAGDRVSHVLDRPGRTTDLNEFRPNDVAGFRCPITSRPVGRNPIPLAPRHSRSHARIGGRSTVPPRTTTSAGRVLK